MTTPETRWPSRPESPIDTLNGDATTEDRASASRPTSSIRTFLAGKTLLVTGTTGFLAKAIVEKILFEAPDVGRLYLLIRAKKRGGSGAAAMTAQARLEKEVLDSPAMSRLRARAGDGYVAFVREKARAVAGDLSLPDLGLSPDDRARLQSEVDVVINSAATVVFDERIDQALALNTHGPRRLVEFAKGAKKRPVFVQISTCYVCGKRVGLVPEALAETPVPDGPRPPEDIDREVAELEAEVDRVMREAATDEAARRFRARAERSMRVQGKAPSQAQVDAAREDYLREVLVDIGMRRARARGWNDTYTYTKAMGERLVVRERGDIPVAIVRPSIIESSLREPEPGWIDGYRMADPLIAAYGRGRLTFFPTTPDVGLDIIPLDLVVNAIIAAIPRAAADRGVAIYQVASSERNALSIRRIVGLLTQHFTKRPMREAGGQAIAVKPFRFASTSQFRWMCLISYQAPLALLKAVTAPFSFVRSVARFRKQLGGKAAALRQLLYFSDIYGPYTTLDVRFATGATRRLFESLGAEDRERFAFDETQIDWEYYIDEVHIPGLRRNVLQAEARRSGEWAGMERVIEKVSDSTVSEAAAPEAWEETFESPVGVAARVTPAPPRDAAVANIRDLLARTAARFPARVALQVRRDGDWQRITYSQLLDRADEIGSGFGALGVRAGDRVILWCEGRPEWGLAYLAVVGGGAVVVPADPQLPEEDFLNLVEVTKPSLLIVSDKCLDRLSEETRRRVRAAGGIVRVDAAFALDTGEPLPAPPPGARPARAAVTEESLASIIFTSGTTVAPKGVMLSHGNFLANVRALTAFTHVTADDAFLSVLPMFHVFEFTAGFLTPLSAGATITYLAELSSATIVGTMKETRTTVMLGVPRLYSLLHDGIMRKIEDAGAVSRTIFGGLRRASRGALSLTKSPAISRALFKRVHAVFGGRIRMFVSGGAPLDAKVYHAFREMGFEVVEGYGLTETAPVLTMNPLGATRPNSVGQPLPGVQLWISRPDSNGVGEVVVAGDNVMRGYYERPDETARVLSNGWFRSGDLGYLDADGYLYLTGRIKDLIITAAGKNVYPDEVEAHYKGLAGVKDFTVIGVRPKGALGEEVHAVVVPQEPAPGAPAESAAELAARLEAAFTTRAARLPSYQHVAAVHVWDGDLPKTSTLKVKRARVKAMIEMRLAGASRAAASASPHVAAASTPAGASSKATDAVIAFLSRLTNVPAAEIAPAKTLEIDLAVDSLMRVEIAAFLESRFGAHLSDEQQLALKTVRDVLDAAERGAGAKRSAAEPAADESESTELVAYWERELSKGNWHGSASTASSDDVMLRRSPLHAVAREAIVFAGRVAYGVMFRLRAAGRENLPGQPRYIIAANHSSHLDSLAVLLATGARGRRLRVVGAKDYFFNTGFKRWFFGRLLHAIPFDRNENFVEGLRLCKRALEQDYSLLIFPEGTRTTTGALQPFKLGVGILARELGVPIVPAYIDGAFEAMPKGRALPRPSSIRVTFGAPIVPAASGAVASTRAGDAGAYEGYKETVEAVRRSIEAMRAHAR
ncbi:MAG: AMP-binding protein [bacterium]